MIQAGSGAMAPMDDRFASAVTPDQLDALKRMLAQNAAIKGIVERAPALSLAHWYLGAGCIAQTAWNVLSGFPAGRSIEDHDLAGRGRTRCEHGDVAS